MNRLRRPKMSEKDTKVGCNTVGRIHHGQCLFRESFGMYRQPL